MPILLREELAVPPQVSPEVWRRNTLRANIEYLKSEGYDVIPPGHDKLRDAIDFVRDYGYHVVPRQEVK
jgi:hypothetical protein